MQVAHQQAFVFAASQQVRSHVGFKKLPAGSYPGLQFEHAEVSGAVRLLTSALSLLQNILCNSLAISLCSGLPAKFEWPQSTACAQSRWTGRICRFGRRFCAWCGTPSWARPAPADFPARSVFCGTFPIPDLTSDAAMYHAVNWATFRTHFWQYLLIYTLMLIFR